VNHGVLASLNPEQVAVEIWRADELEVRRGLSSELDEMESYVCKNPGSRGSGRVRGFFTQTGFKPL
jgi:hypothetical protein